MVYQGQNVEFIQLVSYLGEEYTNKTSKENQAYFKKMISGKLSFTCSFECSIEDMICINHDDVIGTRYTEEEDKAVLLSGLEELKMIFPNSFINLHLEGFIEEGNTVDLTGEEFKELYC